mgnify:FL=1
MQEKKKPQKQNVTKMDNDYIRQNEERKKARSKTKYYVKRRLLILLTLSAIIITAGVVNTNEKEEELIERQKVEKQVALELEDIKRDQDMLKTQVRKLEDDEYILKLARKEYFLSDEGEIIFTMPSDSGRSEKEIEKGSEE